MKIETVLIKKEDVASLVSELLKMEGRIFEAVYVDGQLSGISASEIGKKKVTQRKITENSPISKLLDHDESGHFEYYEKKYGNMTLREFVDLKGTPHPEGDAGRWLIQNLERIVIELWPEGLEIDVKDLNFRRELVRIYLRENGVDVIRDPNIMALLPKKELYQNRNIEALCTIIKYIFEPTENLERTARLMGVPMTCASAEDAPETKRMIDDMDRNYPIKHVDTNTTIGEIFKPFPEEFQEALYTYKFKPLMKLCDYVQIDDELFRLSYRYMSEKWKNRAYTMIFIHRFEKVLECMWPDGLGPVKVEDFATKKITITNCKRRHVTEIYDPKDLHDLYYRTSSEVAAGRKTIIFNLINYIFNL